VKNARGDDVEAAGVVDVGTADDEERWLRCASCRERLAAERARISVNGSHEHEFMNPSGQRFVVLCVATAPGCITEGAPSTVWSWFPARAWRVALCSTCGSHVGWSFESADAPPFYALIREGLR